VIRHLRAGRSLNAETPVIRFTADADPRLIDTKTLQGRLEVILPKPITREGLVTTIKALLAS
jgi:two-component system, chemotaxis family, chemotaxis protein CheY